MGMIKCRECGAKISKKAKQCPACGRPRSKELSLFSWMLIIAVGIFIGSSISSNEGRKSGDQARTKPRIYNQGTTIDVTEVVKDNGLFDYKYDGQKAIEYVLKDPESVRYKKIYLHKYGEKDSAWSMCGTLSAKNSLGGYSGDKRYVSLGKPESTYIENELDNSWVNAWNNYCAKK